MVAPQLKELQASTRGTAQKLNEELMEFYKENEINPFASCLPLVAQIPIFIALYYVLKNFAKDATVQRRVGLVHVGRPRRRASSFTDDRLGRVRARGDLRPVPAAVDRALGHARTCPTPSGG